ARIFHGLLAAITDMAVLLFELKAPRAGSLASSGVGSCDVLFRYGNQSRGNAGRLPGGTPIFVVSRQQSTKYPG
ncbi:MAG: hypothetical protein ACWGP1_06765, partial [Syntrophobacteria bacterium]